MKKYSLRDLFEKHEYLFLVLSIFLLLTIELSKIDDKITILLSLFSAIITYTILISIKIEYRDKCDIPLWIFRIIFPIFISLFCVWVILTIITKITGELEQLVWIIVWLVFTIYPGLRFWFKK